MFICSVWAQLVFRTLMLLLQELAYAPMELRSKIVRLMQVGEDAGMTQGSEEDE